MGYIVSNRFYNDRYHLVTLWTQTHGLWKALLLSSPLTLQIGQKVEINWTGSSRAHLGYWRVENSLFTQSSFEKTSLHQLALQSLFSLLTSLLPERVDYPSFFEKTEEFLDCKIFEEDWCQSYLDLEHHLLAAAGFSPPQKLKSLQESRLWIGQNLDLKIPWARLELEKK